MVTLSPAGFASVVSMGVHAADYPSAASSVSITGVLPARSEVKQN
jgi:hypothetical protein